MVKSLTPYEFTKISKSVGYKGSVQINYPTIDEVNMLDEYHLLYYYRFLKSPENENEVNIMNRIVELFHVMKGN